jgi:hypothetical protein
MALTTESELTFERYVDAQNIGWTRVPTSTQKQPDYRVDHRSRACLFEVKEFDDPATTHFHATNHNAILSIRFPF